MNVLKMFAFLAFFSKAIFAADMLTGEGRWDGQGSWFCDQGKTGKYTVSTVVKGGVVSTDYDFGNDHKFSWSFSIAKAAPGFFKIMMNGQKVGGGYCLEGVPVCHYGMSIKGTMIEETIKKDGNVLYRFGHKWNGKNAVKWQEKLGLAE